MFILLNYRLFHKYNLFVILQVYAFSLSLAFVTVGRFNLIDVDYHAVFDWLLKVVTQ